MHSTLRPDVLLAGLRPTDGGLDFATEVSWMRSLVDLGIPVLAEVNHGLPACADDGPVPADQVVVSEVQRSHWALVAPEGDAAGREIA